MVAYVIVDVEVRERETYQKYIESVERAKAWWASEEYKAPKALRQSASVANMIVVEGM